MEGHTDCRDPKQSNGIFYFYVCHLHMTKAKQGYIFLFLFITSLHVNHVCHGTNMLLSLHSVSHTWMPSITCIQAWGYTLKSWQTHSLFSKQFLMTHYNCNYNLCTKCQTTFSSKWKKEGHSETEMVSRVLWALNLSTVPLNVKFIQECTF